MAPPEIAFVLGQNPPTVPDEPDGGEQAEEDQGDHRRPPAIALAPDQPDQAGFER